LNCVRGTIETKTKVWTSVFRNTKVFFFTGVSNAAYFSYLFRDLLFKKKLFLNFDLDFKRHNLSIALELFT